MCLFLIALSVMFMSETLTPKYPHVPVILTGEDGNAYMILGRVTRALQKHRVPEDEIEAFRAEATSGDYEHLLVTVIKTVTVF